MPLLNDYAGAAVAAIHQHGGEVLKFMGDGILAIFRNDGERRTSLEAATHDALRALCQAQKNLREVRNRRANAGLPRSEEHTSELQSLMRISYAVFRLKK